jgi:hypothetical protein
MSSEKSDPNSRNVERLIAEIPANASGEDAQFRAFQQTLATKLTFPRDGFVIGEPISILSISYEGNPRRGLTATCRKENGSQYVVSLADVHLEEDRGHPCLDAYREWLGISVSPGTPAMTKSEARRHKVSQADLDLFKPIELVVLSTKPPAARCRVLGSGRELTFRSRATWKQVPGEILTVQGKKCWRYAGHPYLSGEILNAREEVTALALAPLQLHDGGLWDPADEYWGEEGEPTPTWAQPIIARGPRPLFEMEQVLPGDDPEDFEDAITRSADLKEAGALDEAEALLMQLLQADLRCLDAHAHLGNLDFDRRPEKALRHYAMGMRIGNLSFRRDFDGALIWGLINNRPYLRCLHGYGLCLWRLGKMEAAAQTFERMLWLNPADNQGARFLLEEVHSGRAWQESKLE